MGGAKTYYPTYRFDPSLAFPELGSSSQSTDSSMVKAAGLSLTLAYLMSGHKFKGQLGTLSLDEIYAEIESACFDLQLDVERLFKWAESILIPIQDEGTLDVIPTRIECKGFNLDNYQRRAAAWSARRMGTVSALGCGVGKTATAVAAAAGAAALGHCMTERCYVVCPLNAMSTWEGYVSELERTFKEVRILSCDSLHKYKYIEREQGGAVIFDEVHRLKNHEAWRTGHAHALRLAFEWGICLTGTLLHTGAEGVMSILDLACPGLSRYMDKWKFGEAFQCIIEKKVGPRTKHSLGIPPMAVRESFVHYLMRGVWSRSYESEDVKEVFSIPGQNRVRVTSWEKPEWVRNMEKEFLSDYKQKFNSQEGINEDIKAKFETFTDEEILLAESPYVWPPDHSWKNLMAATAGAIMNQENEAWHQLTEIIGPEQAGDPPGLPSFSTVLHYVSKMGRHDVILKRTFDNEGTVVDCHFVYAPGSSALNPAPGPKIRWVMQWLAENPDEPVVIGAQGVQTIDAVQLLLQEAKIDYRLIRGGVGNDERRQYIDEFQDGKFRVMLLQQVAGSESVTLIKAATSMLLDHNWSPIPYTQFLARTCRRGQTQECDHFDLAFNELQIDIIKRLVRGEGFDAVTRAQMEQVYRAITQRIN